ncbi:glycoside hydrolase family 15 protein [Rivularia sp. UHCC 0363]|uniref:glycoside hydrolase family 15 protein n=1 Tax=Rivularia sp. UHCC 0363 TaxID=3110244 RepID=UPI002B210A29|nr:glycoside hydrolase family 15 protein [Rivularia sp. UHCC 0363]MEA5592833.1 glycoside hydrolase family 15 protein [Rivularia sp. UHCC 0363]
MGYQPIEDYGIIGNMYTTALVGKNGSIDWFCYPRHDSPSVFAGILDENKGGHFSISPTLCNNTHKQFYWPETNVLVTRFLADCGVGEVVDFMPVGLSPDDKGYHWLVRRVTGVRSSMKFRMECYPAFNYARDRHETQLSEGGVIFKSSDLNLGLLTDIPLKQDDKGVFAEFSLAAGESAVFILREVDCEQGCGLPLNPEETTQIFEHTIEYWRRWISKCTYKGRWRETVERSALALKLLTYEPTGAIIAAPTCSLPESLGGERNWDYRYSWIRDAAFTIYAFMRIGFTDEAGQFINWIISLCPSHLEKDSQLQIVYGIDGRKDLKEEILDHLEGYKGSSPVRIGNGAYNQMQLDIYGELMDAVYLFNKYGTPISYDTWVNLRKYIDWVCDNWEKQDSGIWETRDGKQDFVYSKLMCWVAVDRGLRLAQKRSFPANLEKWLKVRDQIYLDIMSKGWSESKQAFVQYYGSNTLDASNLIMPLIFFMSPTDPRMLKTIDAIMRSPQEGGLLSNSLVFRYNTEDYSDGLDGEEGSFNLCTFWLVEALTRAGRADSERLNKARLIFEEMLSYANHLKLYAEETGTSGEALGNFPQAFTHLALISAAYNLDRSI